MLLLAIITLTETVPLFSTPAPFNRLPFELPTSRFFIPPFTTRTPFNTNAVQTTTTTETETPVNLPFLSTILEPPFI